MRHPLDSVLSTYSHQLTHGHFCAYDLESAAEHYALVDGHTTFILELPLSKVQPATA